MKPFRPASLILVILLGAAGVRAQPSGVPAGIVSWWPLENNGIDVAGPNTGTFEGPSGLFLSGEVNWGWKPGGLASVLVVADDPTLHLGALTFDFWIKINAYTVRNTSLVWKGDEAGSDLSSPYAIFLSGTAPGGSPINPPGTIQVMLTAPASEQFLSSTHALPINELQHVAVTIDGSSIRIYVNGVLDASAPQSWPLQQSGTYPLQFGGIRNVVGGNYFNGVIDEVDVFSRALTPAEIASIFHAGPYGK